IAAEWGIRTPPASRSGESAPRRSRPSPARTARGSLSSPRGARAAPLAPDRFPSHPGRSRRVPHQLRQHGAVSSLRLESKLRALLLIGGCGSRRLFPSLLGLFFVVIRLLCSIPVLEESRRHLVVGVVGCERRIPLKDVSVME